MNAPRSARLGMTLFRRDALPADLEFELGLLTKPPTPEGDQFVELSAPGYRRARILVEPHDSSNPSMRNAAALRIGPPAERWTAPWIGLFTLDGTLIAYGRVDGAPENEGEIAFDAGKLVVER